MTIVELGDRQTVRYTVSFESDNGPLKYSFSAPEARSDNELADILEDFIGILRSPKTEVTGPLGL